MKPIKITNDIYMLSVNVDNSALLFEEMWEIPKGVTLNSFIIKGEKTAIVDGVCGWDGVPETFFKLFDELEINPEDIDYLIVNHMEPDHSAWIENLRKINNNFEIYCTPKASDLLNAFYGYTDNIHVVKKGDELDLGNGKVLKFFPLPGVHWPDTMMTLDSSTNTLFPCDMFGSFGQIEGRTFDDEMSEADFEYFADEEIRYFSNVLATFQRPIQKAITTAREINPTIIAPGHGPIYRKNPNKIIDRYEQIANFREGSPLPEITILWGSMYGMTSKAVEHAKKILDDANITYHNLQLPHVTMGEVLSKVIRSAGVIIAAPTYENKMFPAMVSALDEISRKKISPKKVIYFGSYGWAGGARKELEEFITTNKMKWDILDTVEFNGSPLEEDLEKIEKAIQLLTEDIQSK